MGGLVNLVLNYGDRLRRVYGKLFKILGVVDLFFGLCRGIGFSFCG